MYPNLCRSRFHAADLCCSQYGPLPDHYQYLVLNREAVTPTMVLIKKLTGLSHMHMRRVHRRGEMPKVAQGFVH
jgi:hypothetical protein